ncbi:MAG: hypothetical protein GTO14_22380 [Anaerolineales bacterium]|nr:hypothetical protein [Anaerolineales bacterium]
MPQETRPNITQPTMEKMTEKPPDQTQPIKRGTQEKKNRKVWPWLIAIPVFVLFVFGISIISGANAGLKLRGAFVAERQVEVSQQQFDLGVEDLLAGRYELARQRFEYVLSLDPSYPGVTELLGRALEALNQPTPTPIPLISPTPTETPDLGSYEGIFKSAQSAFAREDWDTTLNLLLLLRGEDPNFKLTEVNQMMAVALRNRGMEKLFRSELEQGVYDLNLAERFGPLDNQATSWRRSAVFYVFANSYYGLDWGLAAEYFGQICVAKIWGACFKYADAAREYANLLIKDADYCSASFYYAESLAQRDDRGLVPTATQAAIVCITATTTPPTSTPTATFTSTPTFSVGTSTATATIGLASLTPTPTASASPTPSPTSGGPPTNTPTPTATSGATFTPTFTPTSSATATPTASSTLPSE